MDGQRCPYVEHEPQTREGRLVWDLAQRCASQVRIAPMGGIVGFDLTALMGAADVAGVEQEWLLDLLPPIEAGMVDAMAKRRE